MSGAGKDTVPELVVCFDFDGTLENGAAAHETEERLRKQHTFVPDVQAALMEAMLASPR